MTHHTQQRNISVCLFVLVITLYSFVWHSHFDVDAVFPRGDYPSDTSLNVTAAVKPHSPDDTADNESLRYIPHSTIQTWKERDYLIVFGILSIDIEARRRRRDLQRTTCWQFPGVARRANNFNGAMLVLYVLARHPSHGYNYSAALLKEADEYHDVVTLRTSDSLPTTNKVIGFEGHWGTEAGISMSRKVYFWFELALRVFPNVNYIAKGDDDMFLRVPQFLADLRTVPRRGIYWGRLGTHDNPVRFFFVVGFCATLSRDIVEHFVSYKPLQRLVYTPYTKGKETLFFSLFMQNEDMMVGFVLRKVLHHNITFVREKRCRFHDFRSGRHKWRVTKNSVMVHHITEEDYDRLMNFSGYQRSITPKTPVHRSWHLEFIC
ncbi:UDP-Gal or UDP-GlcNAc-dependent glycosyltransferase [Trypanosoma theileri]|uniref:Hexosyltransferase n=1 Tax=Trypanosoma theileri TaxID=67003 RepID=A0A1X0NPW4_9TRYP|nr:UDP-Gal or UDP-GlcNAc-dependent glycosyltransferase [Trypanosoma theileri]ORC86756.1 UDP-Gal or UDP-GlcNAc-dependent glycosyltransferase [Trypanosoma theileri]